MADGVVESPIRIFLLIENRLLRDALSRLFRKRSEFEVIGQGGRSEVLAGDPHVNPCDVLAADFFDSDLVTATRGPKIILIGMNEDPDQFLDAVRAGVTGYLLKDASASEVISAIRAAQKGEAICPPRLCATLFRWFAEEAPAKRSRPATACYDITLRQRQLVELVAEGLTNKEIAAHLNLSEFTVRNHIHRIMKQVDVGSRREAVDAILPGKLRANP
jgi:DNA-binding NarL/FixJ family response regulator